jgi:hypothetical protein
MEPIGRSTGGGKYDVDIHYSEREGFYQGFHKAQELNKNKFTEEDMKACWEAAEKAILDSAFVNHEGLILYSGAEVDRDKHTFFHGRQQPKQWRVEVEMEEYLTEGWVPNYNNPDNNNLEESAEIDLRPKVTNNTIKILKVIQ